MKRMDIINEEVFHKSFGLGVVSKMEDNHIFVDFGTKGIKK